jgi:hypothetical protein
VTGHHPGSLRIPGPRDAAGIHNGIDIFTGTMQYKASPSTAGGRILHDYL